MGVLGIDPGLSGAFAVLRDENHLAQIYDMPILEVSRGRRRKGKRDKREIDHHALNELLRSLSDRVDVAYVEAVSAMPGQGVTSMFSFGMTYGAILQALASNNIHYERVQPNTWRVANKVRKGKDGSRMRASELYPSRAGLWKLKKHHNRCDALLIARYGVLDRRRCTLPEPGVGDWP